MDAQGIGHALPDAHLDAFDGDIAEAVGAVAAEAVVEEQADRSEGVPAAALGAGADVDALRIVHVLPDAHVDIDGVVVANAPLLCAGNTGACGEGQRQH